MAASEKFNKWLDLVRQIHPGFEFEAHRDVSFKQLERPLSTAKVALITTAGVHLRSQPPFDESNPAGDFSLREVPSAAKGRELQITHSHYDHRDGDQDINCVFPIDRMQEMVEEGVLGSLADTFYGLSGFTPQPRKFLVGTVPEISRRLSEQRVEAVLLTPG